MSDFLFSSRLVLWTGAVILLAQSVTGQATNLLTLVGVLFLSIGFLAFLAGLGLGGLALERPRPARESPAVERTPDRPAARQPAAPPPQPMPASAPPPAAPKSPPATPVAQPERLETVEVGVGDPEYGLICPKCGQAVEDGQVAVTCPVCSAVQHAACWTDNHFRCSWPDCRGRGSLEAPKIRELEGPRD